MSDETNEWRSAAPTPSKGDALPPHSEEAERGVLGCILLAPDECLTICERQRVAPEWFYDLRYRTVWLTFQNMRGDSRGIDLLTTTNRLKDHGHLAELGGAGGEVAGRAFVAALPDDVPSAANLGYYLDILRDKWVMRNLIAELTHALQQARDYPGAQVDELVNRARARFDQFAQEHVNPTQASSLLKPAGDFGEIVFDRWFGTGAKIEEPGWSLPEQTFGKFPFKIRQGEMTLVLGKSGKGKTTLLSYITLHLMAQGAKVVVASMEMAPDQTLENYLRQLLGVKKLPDTPSSYKLYQKALAWLNARCLILDFRGIIQYRQLLDEFKRAAALGWNVFVGDNLNKLGIMEDDMAAHGQAANDFHGFAVGSNVHLFMVNHENKAGGSRGSLRWTDVTNNLVKVEKNDDKWNKLADGFQMREEGKITHEEFRETYKKELSEWDGKFLLRKQRLPGSLQNGSREMWFMGFCGQFFNHAESLPAHATNWLEKWAPEPPAPVSGHPDGKGES